MKKILHVVNVFFVVPYFLGGQFRNLDREKYEQHLICSPSPLLQDYAKKMKIKYSEVGILKSISPVKDIIAIIKVCSYIRKYRPDVVVGHTPKGALIAMISAWMMRVPKRIYFRHGLVYETMNGIKRHILILADKFTSRCAHQVVCVSPSLFKKSLEDGLNIKAKQLILRNGTCGGIDTIYKFNPDIIDKEKVTSLRKSLGISKDSYVIGYVGRLVRDKGIQDLINAFDFLRMGNKNKKFILLLVGGYEKRDALPDWLVEKINNDHDIINTGFVFNDIEIYYSLMNTLVLPSFREGFGMCVIEASAMKLPVLTTRETGCVDSIIEGKTGEYIDHDPKSIKEGIDHFLDRNVADIYGRQGREFVCKNFEARLFTPELEKLYA